MRQTICDRCNNVVKINPLGIKGAYSIFDIRINDYLDLCYTCSKELESYMRVEKSTNADAVAVAGR